MANKRLLKLMLSESNPDHEMILTWLDSLSSDGRGKSTAKHIEKAVINYINQTNKQSESRSIRNSSSPAASITRPKKNTRPSAKPILGSDTKKTGNPVLANSSSVSVIHEDNKPKVLYGEISGSALSLINNSDFD